MTWVTTNFAQAANILRSHLITAVGRTENTGCAGMARGRDFARG